MDNQVEYVSSQKGVKKVHFQGYRYIRHKNLSRGVVSYHCEMRRKGECKVSMKVLDDQCVGILHEHTHAPDQVQSEVQRIKHWFADGTFKTVPQLYYQLFTIHCLTSNAVIPCVYALMPNKQETTYREVFAKVKELAPDCTPDTLMLDFEKAIWNAAASEFLGIEVKGCFYHLSQNIYRRIQSAGLQEEYAASPELQMQSRMIPALAFIPEDQVVDAFESLADRLPETLQPILDYFEDSYIGRPHHRGRRPPMFAVSSWNQHQRTLDDLPRTNNNLEGWHRRLLTSMAGCHPSIWRFLDVLRREQALNDQVVTQMLAGHTITSHRRQYRDCQQRLQTIAADFTNRQQMEFLRSVAHNIRL